MIDIRDPLYDFKTELQSTLKEKNARIVVDKIESYTDPSDGKTIIRGMFFPLDAVNYFTWKIDEETDPFTDWQKVAAIRTAYKIVETQNVDQEKHEEV